jgi:hypothetical protein
LCGIAEEPTWPSWKPSVSRPCAGHEPERRGETGRRGAELVQRAHHFEIEAARVNLADGAERGVNPRCAGCAPRAGPPCRPAAEQRELVELRADRALEAAHGVARDQLLEPGERDEQLLAEHRDPLAERRRLGGHVVRAARDHEIAVRLGLPAEREQRRGDLEPHQLQRAVDSAAARRSPSGRGW